MTAAVLPADRIAVIAKAFKRRRGLIRFFLRNKAGQALRGYVRPKR